METKYKLFSTDCLFKSVFLAVIFCINAFFALAQNSAPQSTQIDPDWEKIRDAQVMMLKRKEAELDRMKEELLLRAQPGAQPRANVSEIESEYKRREAEWMQKNDKYENEITLFKVKVDEQKTEIESLRKQIADALNSPPVDQSEKVLSPSPESIDSAELKGRETQLQIKEKQLADKEAEIEAKNNQAKALREVVLQHEKEKASFEKQRVDWGALKLQSEQKHEADRLQVEADKKELEVQRKSIEDARITVETEQKNTAQKIKELDASNLKLQDIVKREENIRLRDQELSARRAELEKQEKQTGDAQRNSEEQKRMLSQAALGNETLSKKLSDTEVNLARAEQAKLAAETLSSDLEKRVTTLNQELQQLKDSGSEQETSWKNREQELLQVQMKNAAQISDLELRLAQGQAKLQEKITQTATQSDDAKKDLLRRQADVDEQKNKLDQLAAQLDEKSKKLEEERTQFTSQKLKPSLVDSPDLNSKLAELNQRLEQGDRENEQWRQEKKQIEKNWSDFLNKEMQYQMEIKNLQQRLAAVPSASVQSQGENGGRDWKAEARRVIEERRNLGDEKARLYRQLNLDRQQFEQAQVHFSREQRAFEEHIRNEEARLERLRRQAGLKSE